jgi:hypothetical protein
MLMLALYRYSSLEHFADMCADPECEYSPELSIEIEARSCFSEKTQLTWVCRSESESGIEVACFEGYLHLNDQ